MLHVDDLSCLIALVYISFYVFFFKLRISLISQKMALCWLFLDSLLVIFYVVVIFQHSLDYFDHLN